VVIALFVFLFVRGIAIANRTKDRFHFFLAYGLIIMIAVQALVTLRLLPAWCRQRVFPCRL